DTPSPQPQYLPPQPMLETDARNIAMLVHIIAAVAAIVSAGTLAFVVPLIMWIMYRDRSALVDHHGKQNLNLQITAIVTLIGAIILGIVTLGLGLFITIPLWACYWLYTV